MVWIHYALMSKAVVWIILHGRLQHGRLQQCILHWSLASEIQVHWLYVYKFTKYYIFTSWPLDVPCSPSYKKILHTLSVCTMTLNVPHTQTVLGSWTFSVLGPLLWVLLPSSASCGNSLMSFKFYIKTHVSFLFHALHTIAWPLVSLINRISVWLLQWTLDFFYRDFRCSDHCLMFWASCKCHCRSHCIGLYLITMYVHFHQAVYRQYWQPYRQALCEIGQCYPIFFIQAVHEMYSILWSIHLAQFL